MLRNAHIAIGVLVACLGCVPLACNTGDSGSGDGTSGGTSGVDPGVDAGGTTPGVDGGKAAPQKACKKPADCDSKVCTAAGFCAAASPTDGVKNGNETDTDCGGSGAPKCDAQKGCKIGGDCMTGVCKDVGQGLQCQPAAPDDGVKNGDETDVDCGGAKAPKCADSKGCKVRNDCANDVCNAGKCQAAVCLDAIKNGSETDVDCGGSGCPRCDDNLGCKIADDCKSGVCTNVGGVLQCAPPSPTDNVKNGTETDVDCGGGAAGTPLCAVNKACTVHADCATDGCSYLGKCAVGRSCTGQYGGDTCGSGGAGGRGAANWESCCSSAPAGAGGVSMNKYKVTSGRMRAFITRVGGNVRKSVQDARAAGAMHGAILDPSWDLYLPTALDGCEQNGSCGANELTDYNYGDPGGGYQGIWTSVYRHLGGTIFNGQSLGQQGCSVGSPGTHSYYMDAATQTKYFGDVPPEYGQAEYDTKPMNCVNYLMAQAFCIWDGGRLETQAEYQAAGGPADEGGQVNGAVPWGTPIPKDQSSSTYYAFRFPDATDASLRALNLPASDPNYRYIPQTGRSIEWADYIYSYEYPHLLTYDYIVHLAAPGRLTARSPNGHADLIGTGMEVTSDVNQMSSDPRSTLAKWTANGSFEVHQWGYYGWNFSLVNKYGKQGLRCVYP